MDTQAAVTYLIIEKDKNMKKILFILIVVIMVIIYFFLFLGVLLDLKCTIDHYGIIFNNDQLIQSSFRIGNLVTFQLILFIILSIICIYLLIKNR